MDYPSNNTPRVRVKQTHPFGSRWMLFRGPLGGSTASLLTEVEALLTDLSSLVSHDASFTAAKAAEEGSNVFIDVPFATIPCVGGWGIDLNYPAGYLWEVLGGSSNGSRWSSTVFGAPLLLNRSMRGIAALVPYVDEMITIYEAHSNATCSIAGLVTVKKRYINWEVNDYDIRQARD